MSQEIHVLVDARSVCVLFNTASQSWGVTDQKGGRIELGRLVPEVDNG